MFRVLKVLSTQDGKVEQEGFYTFRELKKAFADVVDGAISVHIFPATTGVLRDVSFEPEPANDNHPNE